MHRAKYLSRWAEETPTGPYRVYARVRYGRTRLAAVSMDRWRALAIAWDLPDTNGSAVAVVGPDGRHIYNTGLRVAMRTIDQAADLLLYAKAGYELTGESAYQYFIEGILEAHHDGTEYSEDAIALAANYLLNYGNGDIDKAYAAALAEAQGDTT